MRTHDRLKPGLALRLLGEGLFYIRSMLSGAKPVCLPWSEDSDARDLEDGVSVKSVLK